MIGRGFKTQLAGAEVPVRVASMRLPAIRALAVSVDSDRVPIVKI